jgi:putative DNA primase/helicase
MSAAHPIEAGPDLAEEIRQAAARGWAMTPLDGKKPLRKGWQSEPPVSLDRLLHHATRGGNIGIRTGKASGIIVIDIDPGADLSSLDLPATWTAITGRGGEHRYFRYPDVPITNSVSTKMGKHVDVRGDGGQLVMVGSVHPETGALYEWAPGFSPDDLPLADLPAELVARLTRPKAAPARAAAPTPAAVGDRWIDAAVRNEVDRVASAPEGTRNHTLNAAAFSLGGLVDLAPEAVSALLDAALAAGLPESEARTTIRSGLQAGQANPRTRHESRAKAGNSNGQHAPAHVAEAAAPEVQADPAFIRSIDPLNLAAEFLAVHFQDAEGRRTLRRYAGRWYAFAAGTYSELDPEALRAMGYKWLNTLCTYKRNRDGEPVTDRQTGQTATIRVHPSRRLWAELETALTATDAFTPAGDLPRWLDGSDTHTDFLALENGLLDMRTRRIQPGTPDFFSLDAPRLFSWHAKPAAPVTWLRILGQQFDGHQDAFDLLQRWAGYLLATDAEYQKILMLVGPPRSSKGTVCRVLSALAGAGNVATPTLASLATPFGLESLIGKRLAIVPDARLSSRSDSAIVTERLLSISGGDSQTVARKYSTDWTGPLPVKFTLVSNEIPNLRDVSGALASRFLLLPMTQSFLGKEDVFLWDKLQAELPAILSWALDGLDALRAAGRFVQPKCGKNAMKAMEELVSPVRAFLNECCTVDAGESVDCARMFEVWHAWCKNSNRPNAGTPQTLGRDLRAAIPGLKVVRKRNGCTKRVDRHYKGVKINGDH